jgi:hypothetical protein
VAGVLDGVGPAAAALLCVAPVGERAATARTLALNLGILAVLGGVHGGRPSLAAAGACVTGAVVLGHAASLAVRVGRAPPARAVGRLVPAVTAGFALQTLTGALTYLLPVVFGRAPRVTAGSPTSLSWVGRRG